jgi:pSer/pThr/pTyr-binding forkhead associated (FHA) protein
VGQRYRVIDLRSANGTFVNDRASRAKSGYSPKMPSALARTAL